MTGFDIIVLIIVGVAAIGGFLRGLVQEVLSLSAWVLAAFAIHYLHGPLTVALAEYMGNTMTTAILAFALLLLIPYAAMKLIARNLGDTSRDAMLGPIDRVLGFGFGAVKGAVIVVIGFSLLVLGYDQIWGYKGRPAWITTARSYPVVNASTDALVQMVSDRRARLRDAQSEDSSEDQTDVQ